jgi:hypothetical protein
LLHGGLDVVYHDVEVDLLWYGRIGPCGCAVIRRELER